MDGQRAQDERKEGSDTIFAGSLGQDLMLDLPRQRVWLAYAVLVALATSTCFWLVGHSAAMGSPVGLLAKTVEPGTTNALFHVLLALCVIVAASRLAGAACRYIGQPSVVGEIVAGLLLGPSALGLVFPGLQSFVLPREIVPMMSTIAQVGAILYMFLTGLELDSRQLRTRLHSMALISHTSIVLPFVLGSGLALLIYTRVASSGVPFVAFALFMGVAKQQRGMRHCFESLRGVYSGYERRRREPTRATRRRA